MAGLIPITVAVTLAVLGLSYLLQTERWLILTRRFTEQPERLFPAAVAMTASGIMIGYAYNDWSDTWPIFVTLLGWLLALEGAVILLLPGVIQKLRRLSDPFLRIYLRCGGVLLLVLGILLWHSLPDT
jgi:threonine/homoserine/homoserine lactone efflux protein